MSPLRIIGGQARGRTLRLPPGTARPTSQKVRGAVFSMLEAQLWRLGEGGWEEARVLDLFAGSGAYGIEALSRGAAWADFVEQDPRTCRVIGENLMRAGYADRARVYAGDVIAHLQRQPAGPLPYAIIFADPPYGYPRLEHVLAEIAARGPASGLGIVIIETGRRDALPTEVGGLTTLRQRVHGDTAITLYLWQTRNLA
jgi:16S rRNA (guanine966-N2)-methyltransferase